MSRFPVSLAAFETRYDARSTQREVPSATHKVRRDLVLSWCTEYDARRTKYQAALYLVQST